MKQRIIETERLLLRPFREADHQDMYEFLAQLRDDEFEGYPGITFENSLVQLKKRIDSEEFYAIQLKESGKVIGNISCLNRDFNAVEVGFIVNADYQRSGYGTEALTAFITAAFESGIHRICAQCDPRNERSWKLLEKAGMKREAHLRQNIFFERDSDGNPIWKDTYVYAILQEDLL